MRRLATMTLVIALLAPSVALAQSNPFGPLPQAATPEPTPVATPRSIADQDSLSKTTLLLIGLGVLVVFVGIGVTITRDARSSLTEEDRRALERREREREAVQKKQRQTAKTKARQKGRQQRQARKANRPR
jgi:hypothetical protein